MARPTTQETESTHSTQKTESTEANHSNEHEHGAQSSATKSKDPQLKDEKLVALRDQILEALLNVVENKKDEIFAVENTETPKASPNKHTLHESSRKEYIVIMEMQELPTPASAPSDNKTASSFRKRKRKQERPCRAPMGDGIADIVEAGAWAKSSSKSGSSPIKNNKRKKTQKKPEKLEKYKLSKVAWSWGRKEL